MPLARFQPSTWPHPSVQTDGASTFENDREKHDGGDLGLPARSPPSARAWVLVRPAGRFTPRAHAWRRSLPRLSHSGATSSALRPPLEPTLPCDGPAGQPSPTSAPRPQKARPHRLQSMRAWGHLARSFGGTGSAANRRALRCSSRTAATAARRTRSRFGAADLLAGDGAVSTTPVAGDAGAARRIGSRTANRRR